MPPPSRHVRRVCLTASSEVLIRRGAILLEDALHTASLPESTGSRVLVVRSLHVGKIHSRQSSASLAVAIEKRLWQLHSTAVHAADPAAVQAAAVYFWDETEPYRQLASRLARQADVSAWFWTLAVPEWQPNLPRAEAFRRILVGVAQTQPGVMAVVALLQELQQRGEIAPLLAALTWQDGAVLLGQSGWQKPNLPLSLVEPFSPSEMQPFTVWRALLVEWTTTWGIDDTRSLWLAAIALLADNPARILNPHLMYRAQQVIKAAQAVSPDLTTLHSSVLEPSSSQPDEKVAQSSVTEPEAVSASDSIESDEIALDQPTLEPSASPVSEAVDDSLFPTSIAPIESSPISELSGVNSLPHAPNHQTAVLFPESPAFSYTESWDNPRHTEYAGLFFLMPLLNHLSLNEFLEAHPHLIEMQFPQYLLHTIAHRLAVPSHDPIWQALPNCQIAVPCQFAEFVVPQSWQHHIYNPEAGLTRFSGSDFEILCDRFQRFPLALWHNSPPTIVQTWLDTFPTSSAPHSPFSTPHFLSPILHTWLTAIRRWSRRYAQMGLLNLIQRPGQLACTRTHIDLLLNHQQADIRIRRVGLDLNPGWVPWLGRVVSFHYLYGE